MEISIPRILLIIILLFRVIKDEVLKLNLASLIPTDLTKIVDTAKNLTSYFDKMDYSVRLLDFVLIVIFRHQSNNLVLIEYLLQD